MTSPRAVLRLVLRQVLLISTPHRSNAVVRDTHYDTIEIKRHEPNTASLESVHECGGVAREKCHFSLALGDARQLIIDLNCFF